MTALMKGMSVEIVDAIRRNDRWWPVARITRANGIVQEFAMNNGDGYATKKEAMNEHKNNGKYQRCLSVRQPWAWSIIRGHKKAENRTWKTAYRGPLLIHAGKSIDHCGIETIKIDEKLPTGIIMPKHLVTGCIIGSVTLEDVISVRDLTESQRRDRRISEWATGPYCWILSHPVEFIKPIPYKGALRLFNVPEEVLQCKD